jgi:hypothetical protein
VSVESLSFFFSFFFCLASRLDLGYDALSIESLNLVTLG